MPLTDTFCMPPKCIYAHTHKEFTMQSHIQAYKGNTNIYGPLWAPTYICTVFYCSISIINIYWYVVWLSLAKPLADSECVGWLSTEVVRAGDPAVTWLDQEREMLRSQERGKRRVRFQSRIEQSIIVVSSEGFRENYAGVSVVAIKQAFATLQGGHRNFLECFSYIVM